MCQDLADVIIRVLELSEFGASGLMFGCIHLWVRSIPFFGIFWDSEEKNKFDSEFKFEIRNEKDINLRLLLFLRLSHKKMSTDRYYRNRTI